MYIAFYNFLKHFEFLYLAQSGFLNLFSYDSVLLNIIGKWTPAIDSDNLNNVLLDLRKAFDLIDHDILIYKHKTLVVYIKILM